MRRVRPPHLLRTRTVPHGRTGRFSSSLFSGHSRPFFTSHSSVAARFHGERHAECTRRPAAPVTGRGPGEDPTTVLPVPREFDPQAMIERFRSRAVAVRSRGIPPIEGPERQRFVEQAQQDFMDYAILGDAEATLVDGILTLRIDLRPEEPGPPG